MYVAPGFSHACSAFTVALFTFVWLRVRDDWSPRGMAALGAAGALMAMTREQDLFLAAGPALDWLLFRLRQGYGGHTRDAIVGIVAAAACFLLVFAPQLAAYKILNGHFGPHASVGNKMKWYAPHARQVLFSPEHGYFVWTPLALLGIAGIAALAIRRERAMSVSIASAFRRNRVALSLIVMILLQVCISGSVESWTVAGGFGQRRFVALTTVLVIGSSWVFERCRPRVLWTVLAVACVYWNVALSAEFATGLMDRQLLEPARNAHDAIVTLPRIAPQLAYRYLFDRQSFYRANPLSR
jgi:hypothetical protein